MFRIFLFLLIGFHLLTGTASAQEVVAPHMTHQTVVKGKVISVENGQKTQGEDQTSFPQKLTIKLLEGVMKGQTIKVDYTANDLMYPPLKRNETAILTELTMSDNKTSFQMTGIYRFDAVLYVLAIFLLMVIVVTGKKGIGAILGLIISFAIIIKFLIPQILSGADPLLTCVIAAFFILLVTTYVAHGISRQTTMALFATVIALLFTLGFAYAAVYVTQLTGYSASDSLDLHYAVKHFLDIRGIFLGGIIIASVGALNDVTTTQAAAIFELAKINPKISRRELWKRGMSVGREHAISLINTLVLAYSGASLSLFLFLSINKYNLPIWSLLNSELISGEIVKTVAGTIGLILAVPIVTIISSHFALSHKLRAK